jgi:hypothetical protein
MRLLLLPLLMLLIIGSDARPADKDVYREPATGLQFPAKLGKWVRGQNREYGPGLGVSVAYDVAAGATATVYVFNLDLKNIPTGTGSAPVKDHFAQAKKDVAEAQKQKSGSSKLQSEGEVRLGAGADAPKALRAVFALKDKDGNELGSQLYVTGYKNQFFKIRITFLMRNQQACEEAIGQLLGELGTLLKN